jgi:two-component system phosphate regulon response regulator PhoB
MLDAILIVEDDEETRRLLARAFRRKGLQVFTAEDGATGLDLIRRHHPAIVVLDLVMPKVSGEELCAALRADPSLADIHVIMLTGLIRPEDRVAGFEVGADDYVTKPFDLREVILRVEAALRRQRDRRDEREEGFIITGALRLDTSAPRAWVRGSEVPLTAAEYRILLALAERPGRVFSREDLAEEIGTGDDHASPRSVDTHIMRLRQKLGPSATVVETVRGAGYRFTEFV